MSEAEFERLLTTLVGLNRSSFSVDARLVVLKALSTLFPHSLALEAAHAVVVSTPFRDVLELKRTMDGGACRGFFTLYSLVYKSFDVRVLPQLLKNFKSSSECEVSKSRSSLHMSLSGKINLMEETLLFLQTANKALPEQEGVEIRLLCLVHDVLVAKQSDRYKKGVVLPGINAFLRQFQKSHQTEIILVDHQLPVRFLRSLQKRCPTVFVDCEKDETVHSVIAKYLALYPESAFYFVTGNTESFSRINVNVLKHKAIQRVFTHVPGPVVPDGFDQPTGKRERGSIILRRMKTKALGGGGAARELLPRNMQFGSVVGLTRHLVNLKDLDESVLLLVAKEVVTELREQTYSTFNMELLKEWQTVEEDLKSAQELSGTTSDRTLDSLLQAVRRTYPTLLLSDLGISALMEFHTQLRRYQEMPSTPDPQRVSDPSLSSEQVGDSPPTLREVLSQLSSGDIPADAMLLRDLEGQ